MHVWEAGSALQKRGAAIRETFGCRNIECLFGKFLDFYAKKPGIKPGFSQGKKEKIRWRSRLRYGSRRVPFLVCSRMQSCPYSSVYYSIMIRGRPALVQYKKM